MRFLDFALRAPLGMTSGVGLRATLALTLCAIAAAHAQTPAAKFVDSARVEIDRAVDANDNARLANTVVLLDRALVAFPNDPYLLHYRGYAAYRQAIAQFVAENIPGASPYIDRGVADLEKSGDKLPWPETFALLSALKSFRIAVDPTLARTIGAELGALSAKSLQLGPNNPRVLYIQAQGALKTPPEYGGGPDKARDFLNRALKAFETDKPAPLAPTWGRNEAIAFGKQLPGGDDRFPR